MMSGQDISHDLAARVAEASQSGTALTIHGSGSKTFYGRASRGETLAVDGHTGIVNYEPTELVLTARAGTPLAELDEALAAEGQQMPFDPPRFGGGTLGGAIATGLSGPGRPWLGAARDQVLGLRLINGRGEHMRFGGEVMKNVAGYDVSRLMAGALGTLGVLTEVSLKVLPRPEAELGLRLNLPVMEGFSQVEDWFRQGFPVTGAAHDGSHLHLRLSGSQSALQAAGQTIGGEHVAEVANWWSALRDQALPFFEDADTPLWRVSLPPLTDSSGFDGPVLHDWNGQQLWLRGARDAAALREQAASLGGHAVCFRGGDQEDAVFHPLAAPLQTFHRRLKQAFDPAGILNPGRMYADF
ncbi:glycolate oxidase subunit GlcE [Methylonatrum kenyense]|uniref:glycolate oxidase subunit GlcE n=1 Tax=Methylonatrum kenyense TaxID=455253 RepID=UPI0020BE163E|nr:glycolate oxidase subunit GlcE [Methylonatrum kenyense]MCK8515764.1 glycolate oxidase subunit GlcE [Methylonatrum kenyense]